MTIKLYIIVLLPSLVSSSPVVHCDSVGGALPVVLCGIGVMLKAVSASRGTSLSKNWEVCKAHKGAYRQVTSPTKAIFSFFQQSSSIPWMSWCGLSSLPPLPLEMTACHRRAHCAFHSVVLTGV